MPPFKSRHITVALDVAGCPNRCRHCYVGQPSKGRASEETLRSVVKQFRQWVRPGQDAPFVERLTVATWYREPDFADNYRDLWELEKELSDPGAARRFELLSTWRLAREEDYARWAKGIGTEVCQISFFGLEETTDWFTRRRGSFRDNLTSTERLLAAGIRPRWQLFLTERILPDLPGLLALVEKMSLEDRVRELGHEFHIFIHTPSPSGEGFHIEHLRPTVDALQAIPPYLAEKTLRHLGVSSLTEWIGEAEGDLVTQLLKVSTPVGFYPAIIAFFVTPELDVYPNSGEVAPSWRLGSLAGDGLDTIMMRFERDEVPGLYANFRVPISELAERYGRPQSRLLHSRSTLLDRWTRMYAEEMHRRNLRRRLRSS